MLATVAAWRTWFVDSGGVRWRRAERGSSGRWCRLMSFVAESCSRPVWNGRAAVIRCSGARGFADAQPGWLPDSSGSADRRGTARYGDSWRLRRRLVPFWHQSFPLLDPLLQAPARRAEHQPL